MTSFDIAVRVGAALAAAFPSVAIGPEATPSAEPASPHPNPGREWDIGAQVSQVDNRRFSPPLREAFAAQVSTGTATGRSTI
jgi:hypothetical protein